MKREKAAALSDRIAAQVSARVTREYAQAKVQHRRSADTSAGGSVVTKAARIPSPEETIIKSMMASHDPAIREQGWAARERLITKSTSADEEQDAEVRAALGRSLSGQGQHGVRGWTA